MKGEERWKKKTDGSRLVGDRFNKQENLHVGSCKTSRSLSPHTRILKVYIETLTEFSYIYCLDGLDDTLLFQDYALETAPSVGMMGGIYIPRTEEEMKRL